ncbi:M48 family metallopeptidase [Candidatus Saccharibacteria bacterium]|nr:M48 family metallopeptidase [Candidatus Saccharibacteria bacterium]
MIIEDQDLGKITVRRNSSTAQIKFSLSTKGNINMSVPRYLPGFYLQRLIRNSKPELIRMKSKYTPQNRLTAAEVKAADKKARQLLPIRLDSLAKQYGYKYNKVRLSHATTRWGSYSSRGTVSLNVGLIRLPDELIDYVLIHELVHSKHMNHSAAFWQEVASHVPDYKNKRKQIAKYRPLA